MLLKIAPDLDEHALDEIAAVVRRQRHRRPDRLQHHHRAARRCKSRHAGETGGLSGKPLFAPSTEVLRADAPAAGQIALCWSGVGGIAGGADAYAKIRAGASLVQLYTALVYQGPGLVARIKRELLACLARDGFANVDDGGGVWRQIDDASANG